MHSTDAVARASGLSYRQVLPERVAAKITVNDSGCWLWVGPVPEGMELDHCTCFVTICVNPDNLEPVTHAENVRRHFARAEACKHGHSWTPENTGRSPSHGRRYCNACNREKQRRLRQARR